MKSKRKSVLGVIPARYASTRFPGKPLALIHGKTMIRRVYEACIKSNCFEDVIVATDDSKIKKEVLSFGGNCVMTNSDHPSGTDRCIEAYELNAKSYDILINIQGDEPGILQEQFIELISLFEVNDCQIATLIKEDNREENYLDPNVVKCVKAENGKALYFSRSPIPHRRDGETPSFYKHIGLYGFKADVVSKIKSLEVSPLENTEKLEQLRWLDKGLNIFVKETQQENIGIDTPEDLKKYNEQFKE